MNKKKILVNRWKKKPEVECCYHVKNQFKEIKNNMIKNQFCFPTWRRFSVRSWCQANGTQQCNETRVDPLPSNNGTQEMQWDTAVRFFFCYTKRWLTFSCVSFLNRQIDQIDVFQCIKNNISVSHWFTLPMTTRIFFF